MFKKISGKKNDLSFKEKSKFFRQENLKLMRKNQIMKRRIMYMDKNKKNTNQIILSGENNLNLDEKIKIWLTLEPEISKFGFYISLINSEDILQNHEGIIFFRKLINIQKENIFSKIIENEILDKIFLFANSEINPHLQLEATWCLANLLASTKNNLLLLKKKGILKLLIKNSKSQYPQLVEQALWGLGNFSGKNEIFSNILLESEAYEVILQIFDSKINSDFNKKIIWIFSNLCANNKNNGGQNEKISNLLIRLVNSFISYPEKDIKIECLIGIAKYTTENYIHIFTNEIFLKTLRNFYNTFLKEIDTNTHTFNILNSILYGISTSEDEIVNSICNYGYLADFNKILNVRNNNLLLQILGIINNIGCQSERNIQMIFNESGLIDKILFLIYHKDDNVSFEAIKVIYYLTKTKFLNNIQILVQKNFLRILKEFLTGMDCEKKLNLFLCILKNIFLIFDSENKNVFVNLLKESQILNCLENLQKHDSDNIYLLVNEIITENLEFEKYFNFTEKVQNSEIEFES